MNEKCDYTLRTFEERILFRKGMIKMLDILSENNKSLNLSPHYKKIEEEISELTKIIDCIPKEYY